MSFAHLFTMSYWFSQPFTAYGLVKWFWVLSFLFLILFGIVARIVRNSQNDKTLRELWRRVSNLGFTTGLLGLLWLFFRQERIPFFAWRFWLLIWLVLFVWWLCNLLIYSVKRLPVIREEKKYREEISKYLPGKK